LIRLRDFEDFLHDSPQEEWLTASTRKALGGEWFADQIRGMTDRLRQRDNASYSRLTPTSTVPLRDLAQQSLATMIGPLNETVVDFLGWCILHGKRLPVTVTPTREPCGIYHTCHNLSPEWLRHVMGVFYDKDQFSKAIGGRQFFPFENRDHFLHSLLVANLGWALMGIKVSPALVEMVRERVPARKRPWLVNISTLGDLMENLYRLRQPNFFPTDLSARTWLKCAWTAVAFWHDAGYDAATWHLLTSREFAHCRPLTAVKSGNVIGEALETVQLALASLLPTRMRSTIRNDLEAISRDCNAYCSIWRIDGCHLEDESQRYWGRLHALLSAFEFLRRFGSSPSVVDASSDVKSLAAAIAVHHEPRMAHDAKEATLVRELIDNPIGELLYFVDSISIVQRVKLDWASGPVADVSGRQAMISLSMDLNAMPIVVDQDTGDSLPLFFSGRSFERPAKRKKRALWGYIMEKPKPLRNEEACDLGRRCGPRPG